MDFLVALTNDDAIWGKKKKIQFYSTKSVTLRLQAWASSLSVSARSTDLILAAS